jgi:hypothetical protein
MLATYSELLLFQACGHLFLPQCIVNPQRQVLQRLHGGINPFLSDKIFRETHQQEDNYARRYQYKSRYH